MYFLWFIAKIFNADYISLHRSEGPAQVFLIILVWLIAAFQRMSREERRKVFLSYDNMCHVDNLRVARRPLPLPGDLQFLWRDLNKVIDSLHLQNHKDPRCHQDYNPEKMKEKNPDYNTMCCEQTFAWLSRFKKILAAMQKTHRHFYLHRMVKRRNKYISFCYEHGRRPIQPKVK